MSWLRIVHCTRYAYRVPVRFGEHRLVLRPREGHDLRVERHFLHVTPGATIDWSRDVFGNSIATLQIAEAAPVLDIVSDVLVWRPPDAHAPADAAATEEWPVEYDPLEAPMARGYQDLVYPEDRDVLRAWIDRLGWPHPPTAEGILARLNQAIHRGFSYRRREEEGVWTPRQVLERGAGSCRDLATLLLEAARELGFAARFASGYLDNTASAAGRGSTHAWVEAYLPRRGWRGFDPTLGENTSLQHVVTGVSNHPRGVMPVAGRYVGSRDDFQDLEVAVTIERLTGPPSHVAETSILPVRRRKARLAGG